MLSQLNSRAFRSIRKSTTIMMDIAVVKKGNKTPIEVASEPRPFNCRSISVELELGAGEYYVYVSIKCPILLLCTNSSPDHNRQIRLDQSRMIPVDGICGVEYGYSVSLLIMILDAVSLTGTLGVGKLSHSVQNRLEESGLILSS